MVNTDKPMCIITIPYQYGDILLNADDAYVLFNMLCKAEAMKYDYGDGAYKRNVTSDRPTLKVFTLTDYAKLALNSDNE
jgi:hypothetical protein